MLGSVLIRIARSPAARVAASAVVVVTLVAGIRAEEPPPTEQPPEQPAAASEAQRPQPFAAAEVPQALERANLERTRVEALLEPQADVMAISGELSRTFTALEGMYEDLASANLDQRTLRQLDDSRQSWLVQQSELQRWQATLEARVQALETEKANLSKGREVWRLTRETAAENELPESLVEQLDSMLEQVDGIEDSLDERRNAVLDLQSRIATEGIRLQTGLSRIKAAQERASKNLFSADRGWIWSVGVTEKGVGNLGTQVGAAWRRIASGMDRFVRTYDRRLLVQPLLFAAWLVLLVLLRRRSGSWDREDPSLKAALHAVRRPVATALLTTLLMTRILYPRAPAVIFELNVLIAMVPVLRVVPGMVWPRLRKQFYGLIGLIGALQVQDLTLEGSFLERLLLLLVNALALGGLAWALRPGGPAADPEAGRLWRAALFFGRLGGFGLAIALVANLIGAVKLAKLLTEGILGSALAALIMLAVVLILDGLLTLFVRSRWMRSLASVRRHGELIRRRALGLVRLGAVVWWGWVTLIGFRLQVGVYEAVSAFLGRQWTLGSFQFSVGNVLAFLLTVWIATLVSRLIRFELQEDVLPRIDLPQGVPATISMLVHYTILALGFVLALAAAGIEVGQFAILAGALGVGIGFGLQNLVNNFVSGLILIFERPIKVGDTVEIGALLGEVRSIGIRASTIRAYTGAEVIVPNGNLIANEVINWTLSDRKRRIEIPVGVAYGTDPKRVIELLTEVAKKQPDALERPEPWVVFRGFGESSLDFELRFWTNSFDRWLRVQSQATVAVSDALAEAGIEIPFPQRDLHVRSADQEAMASPTGGKTADTGD
jgi:small-conductance mechanosensitive channel